MYFGNESDFATHVLGYGGDSFTSVWCLQWWPWAIAHGINPFVTQKIWYPEGIAITWVTSIPALSLLALPLTLLCGAIVSFNVLALLAPALSAWSVFLLVRSITRNNVSALLSGYIFGFSSYEFAHTLGHLNLSMTCIVPLLLLVCRERLAQQFGAGRSVTLLTLGLLVQFGISLEIFATACIFGAIAWMVLVLFAERAARGRYIALARDFAISLALVLLLTSPFLFFLMTALPTLPKILNSPNVYSADLANFLIPNALTRLGSAYFNPTASRFTGGLAEQTAYLGVPAILILAGFFARHLAAPVVRAWLVILLVLILCSLGPKLWINGTQTGISLPWKWVEQTPLLRNALPGRFTLYVFLLSALLIGIWLAEPGPRPARIARYVLAFLACLSMLPNRDITTHWRPAGMLPFFDARHIDTLPAPDQPVLLLPGGPTGYGMIWQWQARYRFSQTGGYTGLTPPAETAAPIFAALNAGADVPGLAHLLAAYCNTHRVTAVLAGAGTSLPLLRALRDTGWRASVRDGITMFVVPPH